MQHPKIPQTFYARDTLLVARDLIGKHLVRRLPDGTLLSGIINETEAYCGPQDLACHASKGRTARTSVMFGPPGHWYVYLIYGMYWCANLVTEQEDYPAAVLLRGVLAGPELPPGIKTDGPGKLCRAFQIDKSVNWTPSFGDQAGVWVEDRCTAVPPSHVATTPRIGVAYAGEYKDKPWRFLWKG